MGNSTVREKSRGRDTDDSGPSMVAKSYGSTLQPDDNISYGESSDFIHTESQNELVVPGLGIRTSSMAVGIDINARKLPTVFRWDGPGKNIYLSGSYDNWKSRIPLVKSRHEFFTIVDLPEGTHQYKYHIDGQWVCDNNQEKIPNTYGTENNVISVKSSDFEVFEALGIDNAATGHVDDSYLKNRRPGSPPGEYGQVVPPKESSHGVRRGNPPILPAHLLQVILNKEIPQHCEPSLLPEPNHVMLNHLYALSIKDGVMVLSTTHRYRKKYITTIMYKPI